MCCRNVVDFMSNMPSFAGDSIMTPSPAAAYSAPIFSSAPTPASQPVVQSKDDDIDDLDLELDGMNIDENIDTSVSTNFH